MTREKLETQLQVPFAPACMLRRVCIVTLQNSFAWVTSPVLPLPNRWVWRAAPWPATSHCHKRLALVVFSYFPCLILPCLPLQAKLRKHFSNLRSANIKKAIGIEVIISVTISSQSDWQKGINSKHGTACSSINRINIVATSVHCKWQMWPAFFIRNTLYPGCSHHQTIWLFSF